MKIAVMGKGGSGKTTLAALISLALLEEKAKTFAIDADININLPRLFGYKKAVSDQLYLSSPENSDKIKGYLVGSNNIKDLGAFRKTTPPTRRSHLLYADNLEQSVLTEYILPLKPPTLVVGTYHGKEIGTACYHNNLAILENILSHWVDRDTFLVVDTVAGTDSFASSMHLHFDAILLVVEPTASCVAVANSFYRLAKAAKIADKVYIVGNKIVDQLDQQYLKQNCHAAINWSFSQSQYLRHQGRTQQKLAISELEQANRSVLSDILKQISVIKRDDAKYLKSLHRLHQKYTKQDYIKQRYGDLSLQIDKEFSYE